MGRPGRCQVLLASQLAGAAKRNCLGPPIFNLYINDISKKTDDQCIMIQYADDMTSLGSNSIPQPAKWTPNSNHKNLAFCF